jgi:1-acyl-sn-glycerol-3-phosphate acyltransferase
MSDFDSALKKVLDPETRLLLIEAAATRWNPDSLDRENVELIERLIEPIDLLMRLYFRFEACGIDEVPRGPGLVVVNHDAGITDMEIIAMGARWYRQRGVDDRILGLMHDAMFGVPYLSNLLCAVGAVRASQANAEAALARGYKILVAPGGNVEAFRPWRERHRIKFAERRGWARIAVRSGVPVFPVVFIGGHETFVVLHDGQPIVKALGLKRLLRVETFPLFLGLPWGLGVGPLFHLPLPSKCVARFLSPIEPPRSGGEEARVGALYESVRSAMQVALDELAAERRLPVLG